MKLKPGCAEEYKRRHDHIWPELTQLLAGAGIRGYGIFLDKETDTLFAVQELPDDFNGNDLSKHPVMKKWWAYMADIMDTEEDLSPVAAALEEMFYMK